VNIIDGILSRKVFGGLKPHLEMEIQPLGAFRFPRDDFPRDVLKLYPIIYNQPPAPLFALLLSSSPI